MGHILPPLIVLSRAYGPMVRKRGVRYRVRYLPVPATLHDRPCLGERCLQEGAPCTPNHAIADRSTNLGGYVLSFPSINLCGGWS